jgi:hypothetical protein
MIKSRARGQMGGAKGRGSNLCLDSSGHIEEVVEEDAEQLSCLSLGHQLQVRPDGVDELGETYGVRVRADAPHQRTFGILALGQELPVLGNEDLVVFYGSLAC